MLWENSVRVFSFQFSAYCNQFSIWLIRDRVRGFASGDLPCFSINYRTEMRYRADITLTSPVSNWLSHVIKTTVLYSTVQELKIDHNSDLPHKTSLCGLCGLCGNATVRVRQDARSDLSAIIYNLSITFQRSRPTKPNNCHRTKKHTPKNQPKALSGLSRCRQTHCKPQTTTPTANSNIHQHQTQIKNQRTARDTRGRKRRKGGKAKRDTTPQTFHRY